MFLRLKLWLIGAGVVILALVSIWFGGKKSALADIKVKNLEAAIDAEEIEDEVEALDDDTLRKRASTWVRKS